MTDEEIRQVLMVIKTAYPQSFARMDKRHSDLYLALWQKAFRNENAEMVRIAVYHFIYETTRDFAPNIGQIKDYIHHASSLEIQKTYQVVYPGRDRIMKLESPPISAEERKENEILVAEYEQEIREVFGDKKEGD